MNPNELSEAAKQIKRYEGRMLALEAIVRYLVVANPDLTIDEAEVWLLICALDQDEDNRKTAKEYLSAIASAAASLKKPKKPDAD